jgi:glutamyl/glutaminyl-tRNA synthetase
MMNLISSMTHDISSEKASKDAEYAELRTKIRDMSRQLATNRKELNRLRPQSMETDLVELRITNLDEQKIAPDAIEWTGRTQQVMDKDVSPAFWRRKQPLVQPAQDASLVKAIELALDSSSPEANSQETLILLRRMKMWHERIQAQMKQHKASVELNSEKELQLRKFLALCTGLSELEVEEVSKCIPIRDGVNLFACSKHPLS